MTAPTTLDAAMTEVEVLALVADSQLTAYSRDRGDRTTVHWRDVSGAHLPLASLTEARLNLAVDHGHVETGPDGIARLTGEGRQRHADLRSRFVGRVTLTGEDALNCDELVECGFIPFDPERHHPSLQRWAKRTARLLSDQTTDPQP